MNIYSGVYTERSMRCYLVDPPVHRAMVTSSHIPVYIRHSHLYHNPSSRDPDQAFQIIPKKNKTLLQPHASRHWRCTEHSTPKATRYTQPINSIISICQALDPKNTKSISPTTHCPSTFHPTAYLATIIHHPIMARFHPSELIKMIITPPRRSFNLIQ